MSNALAKTTDELTIESAMRLAGQLIHARNMIPASIQHPGEVLGIILTGRELGMAPMMALRSISFVGGKPVMDAAAQLGLMRQRGAKHKWLTASDDPERASIELSRAGDEPYISTFTIEMARRMGLASKPNWQKMPAQMLRARAITAGLRAWMPEAMAGVFDPEELEHHHQPQPAPMHVETRTLPAGRYVPGGGYEVERTDAPRQLGAGGYVEVATGDGPFGASTATAAPQQHATSQAGSPTSPTSTTVTSPSGVTVEGQPVPRTITDVLSDINVCNHLDKLDALIKEARSWYKRLPPALQHEVTVVCQAAPAAVAERDALRREDERAERELARREAVAFAPPPDSAAAGGPLDDGDDRGGQTGRVEDGYQAPLEPGANDEPDLSDLEDAQRERQRQLESGAPEPGTEVF